jgi:hypothetical protein
MTSVSDRFSGIGVAIRSEVRGQKDGKPTLIGSTLVHENTAVAAGAGALEQILPNKHLRIDLWHKSEKPLPNPPRNSRGSKISSP